MQKILTRLGAGIMTVLILIMSMSSALVFAADVDTDLIAGATEITLPNADFEYGDGTNWNIVADPIKIAQDQWDSSNSTYTLQIPETLDGDTYFSADYAVKLSEGTYYFTFDISGNTIDSYLSYKIAADDDVIAKGDGTYTTKGWAAWQTETTAAFTLDSAATVTFSLCGTKAAAYWGNMDNLKLYGTGSIVDDREVVNIELPNADFEYGDGTNWNIVADPVKIAQDQWDSTNSTYTLQIPETLDGDTYFSAAYTVTLSDGTYYFTFDLSGNAIDSYLSYKITAGDDVLAEGDGTYTTGGWAVWQTETTEAVTLTADTEITFSLCGTKAAAYWGNMDNLKLYGTGSLVATDPEPVEANIYVPYIKGTGGDGFMRGVDVSSLLSVLNSGAQFKDWDGNSLGETVEEQGKAFFELLADAGVNWVRLRVWNDPFDADHNGYGGGNNDVEAAVVMGKWATDAGIRLLIDFHYSDFWADPGKQTVPKAWSGYTVDEKAAAIESYTYDSLKTLLDAGVDVGMVQVGNETTNSICGESSWANKAKLFSAGSAAIRNISAEYEADILVAIHFTNPERSGNYANFAKQLNTYGVDYDVFASSYYPYWHGTLDNLTSVLKQVADTYGKQVVVAETSWAYTLDDGDGHDNTVRKNNNDSATYEFSPQGQATEVSSVMQAVKNVGDAGVGVFYWEAAWIPVVNVSELSGDERTAQIEANKLLWEQYGSGWASSYAAEYDPSDAGVWYGGSAVDNQALFDFDGNPLESLNVFKYVTTGTAGFDIIVESIETFAQTYSAGAELALPETASVTYNFGAPESLPVTWDEDSISNVDMNTPGTYTVTGTVGEVGETVCVITVNYPNLLSNPGFESSDVSMYNISSQAKRTTDDPHSGSYSLHFYNSGTVNFTVDQTVTLSPGRYTFSLYAQGGNIGASPATYAYVKFGDTVICEDFALTGWAIWDNPSITFTVTEETDVTVGANVTADQNGAWGTLDDWYLSKAADCPHELTKFDAHDATCTENGNIEYWHCEICDCYFSDEGVTLISPASVTVYAAGHIPGDVETVTEASATAEGLKVIKCTVCNEVLEEIIIPATSVKLNKASATLYIADIELSEDTITVVPSESAETYVKFAVGYDSGIALAANNATVSNVHSTWAYVTVDLTAEAPTLTVTGTSGLSRTYTIKTADDTVYYNSIKGGYNVSNVDDTTTDKTIYVYAKEGFTAATLMLNIPEANTYSCSEGITTVSTGRNVYFRAETEDPNGTATYYITITAPGGSVTYTVICKFTAEPVQLVLGGMHVQGVVIDGTNVTLTADRSAAYAPFRFVFVKSGFETEFESDVERVYAGGISWYKVYNDGTDSVTKIFNVTNTNTGVVTSYTVTVNFVD